MTTHDLSNYVQEVSDMDTYFASRRVLVPLIAEFPDLTPRTSLALTGLAQFDVNGKNETINSQYLEAFYLMEPYHLLHLNAGAVAALSEVEGTDPQVSFAETQMSFAASAGADWELPTRLQDMLSLQVRWSSGNMSGTIRAFSLVSGITTGEVFTPRLTGLMHTRASYRVRPIESLSMDAAFSYFVRTDTETFYDSELNMASDSRLLGGELYCSVRWAPDIALQLTVGGGAFFPGMGRAFNNDAAMRWKAVLGLIVSF
jgi:hypothetical protein